MFRRDLLLGGAAIGGAGIIGAPAVGQTASSSVVKFVPQANLSTIDPFWTTAYIARNHGYLVYDQLYGVDDDYKVHPQAAAGHVVENDGLRWVFTLRSGMKFHDGETVRAKDAVASIGRWAKRDAFGQRLLTQMDSMTALDDLRFEIKLKKPFPMMLDAFAKVTTPCLFIMPERVAQTDAFTQITDATGSGPYKFVRDQWVPGSKAVWERYAGYSPRPDGGPAHNTAGTKVAHFERVEWHIIPDAATAAAAVTSGEIDWWEQPTADLFPSLARNRNVTVEVADPMGLIGTFRPNHTTEPFNNPAVRRAVITAINQADMMTAVIGTDASLIRDNVGFFAPRSPLASDIGLDRYHKSIDEARAALQAAGAMGSKLVLLAATDLASINACSLVGGDLFKRMGFDVEYVATDWGTVVQRRASREPIDKGGWSGFFTFWSGIDHWTPAGHNAIRGNGAQAWFGWPDIPAIEAGRDAWFDAPNLAAQQAATKEMQRVAFDQVPYVPTGQYFQPTAYRKSLTGVLKGPPVFWNIKRV
ncbi:peptide/nickel transport system substrate-binding protein [Humitalea rosea]|uniref:Peptide/nickel transport system substrate-binding protein n=1 Tax=Humitalea rosea TaxID=990373 RepID=A0A2W7INP8_9PROT|nr:ABC transporter substrate-binding protein [Humitalea rosea]PZW49124.1 peptide/nickel transport system substrate-binding protein [Humitalea rosea]